MKLFSPENHLSGFYLNTGEVDREQWETSVSMAPAQGDTLKWKMEKWFKFLRVVFFFFFKIKLVPYLIKYSSLL